MAMLWTNVGEPDTALRREAFETLAAAIIETYLGLPEDALAAAEVVPLDCFEAQGS